MWETADPKGRPVVLEWTGWVHILRRHSDLDVTPHEIVDVVARPDEHLRGRGDNEEWFYRRGRGPSAWIRVVVHYESGRGLIVTAFPRRSIP